MTDFEAGVMEGLYCIEALRNLPRLSVWWEDDFLREIEEIERARRQEFVRGVLEERLWRLQRKRFYDTFPATMADAASLGTPAVRIARTTARR
ncbi:hypothetical protein L0Y40_00680 [Candidatus Wolfebacteria bacterium]|nr:hypothetical protein [Candidatus Wolfebacteria bacterium]